MWDRESSSSSKQYYTTKSKYLYQMYDELNKLHRKHWYKSNKNINKQHATKASA